jgi:hypothetical protein
MRSLLQDLRFAGGILGRSPVITLWIILALELGIGIKSAMFGVVIRLLRHPASARTWQGDG